MKSVMTRWNVLPLYPNPFSPVHKARKFSAVFGTTSARSYKSPKKNVEIQLQTKNNIVRNTRETKKNFDPKNYLNDNTTKSFSSGSDIHEYFRLCHFSRKLN